MANNQGYFINPLAFLGFQKHEKISMKFVTPDGEEVDITDVLSGVLQSLDGKVDKKQGLLQSGRVLYVNANGYVDTKQMLEFTDADRQKLAQIPEYGIEQVSADDGYLCAYQLYAKVGTKKTLLPQKINIPKDFYLRDVDIVTQDGQKYFRFVFVTASGDKVQLLPFGDLSPKLTDGVHTKAQNSSVDAHSFVPQYDNVAKVLPGEDQFQYIGPTTPDGKWVQDYFYRKKLVTRPIVETKEYNFPAGTEYLDVLVDGYQLPKGRYYKLPAEEQKPNEVVISYKTHWGNPWPNNTEALYQSASDSILKVGDKVWTKGDYSESTEFLTITETIVSNQGYLTKIRVSNGSILEIISGGGSGGGRSYKHGYFVSTDGIIAFIGDVDGFDHYIDEQYLHNMEFIGVVREEIYRGNNHPCLYYDGLGFVPNTARINVLDEGVSKTVTYTHGEEVYDWVQANVQPQGIPAELADKIHDQNTDHQLVDEGGDVRVRAEADKVTISAPILAGRYGNIGNKALAIGNGTSDASRSNAFTVDYNGHAEGKDFSTPTHSLNKCLMGKACTFSEMMADYQPGNGMVYMIYE